MKEYSTIVLIILASAAIGCEPSAESESKNTSSVEHPVECSTLAESECIETDLCMPITGTLENFLEYCDEPEQFVACAEFQSCEPEITYSQYASGRMWRFPNSCLPTGWDAGWAPPSEAVLQCEQPLPDCSQSSEIECRANSLCGQLVARRTNASEHCYEATQFVGCHDNDEPCLATATCARDPLGELWWFRSSCIPSGWQEASCIVEDVRCDQPMPDCSRLSVFECGLADGCSAVFGNRVDASMRCAAPNQYMICREYEGYCEPKNWLATDPSGGLWEFHDCDVPSGWQEVPYYPIEGMCD